MTKRQLQAIETKKRITKGAISLISEQDYEKTTIADICNAAGVSVGHFYNYYDSKEELLRANYAAFDEFVEKVFSGLAFDSPWDAVRALVYLYAYNTKRSGPKIIAQILRVQLSVSSRYMTGDTGCMQKNIRRLMQEAAKNGELGMGADKAAEYLLREIRGLVFDWAMREDSYDIIEKSLSNLEIAIGYLQSGKEFSTDKPVYKKMKKIAAAGKAD
jgi:AcrR family transcriptional regulator